MPDIPEINFTVTPAESVSRPVDPSLSIEGMAADAKAVGDALAAEESARTEGLAAKLDTYSELESLEELEGTDELPVGHGGAAGKADLATLAAALQSIGGPLSVANGGTGADTVQGARVALGNAAYRPINNYLQSAVTSSDNADVSIASVSVTLPAGNYMVVAFAYVHQDAGSGRLKVKYGDSQTIESVVSDGVSGNTVGMNAMVMGTITSDGTAQTVALAINAGASGRTMTARAYMQYTAIAIRI